MAKKDATGLSVITLTHDLLHKQSIATLRWNDNPQMKVSLPVSFGCDIDDVLDEAQKSLRILSAETATLVVSKPV